MASQAGMRLVSDRSSDLRFAWGMPSSSWGESPEEPVLRRRQVRSTATSPLPEAQRQSSVAGHMTPPRQRAPVEEEALPSPGAQSSVSGGLEDLQEGARVVRDVLTLLTCEELRAGLRGQGYLTTGVKSDLIERFSTLLSPVSGRNELPTARQLKFLLWLWRQKSLRYKCTLRWTDIFTKTAISQWLYQWKDTPS